VSGVSHLSMQTNTNIVFLFACLPGALGQRSEFRCNLEGSALEPCRMYSEDTDQQGQSEPITYGTVGDTKDFSHGLAACL
jgi:hypothetical protein